MEKKDWKERLRKFPFIRMYLLKEFKANNPRELGKRSSEEEVICPYCGKEAKWVENKEIYGKNYGKSYMAYLCSDCNAYVGCHNNTRKPLGTMANDELRALRIQCHNMIDPLWKEQGMNRGKLYRKLSEWWGKEFHIGELRENDCRRFLLEFDLSKLKTKEDEK